MDALKRFRTSPMGYHKEDVNTYIADISKHVAQRDKENEELKNKVHALEAEVNELKNKRNVISDAIMKAEQYSKDIVEDAQNSASAIKEKIEQEFEKERERLDHYKQEVEQFRQEIAKKLESFQEKL